MSQIDEVLFQKCACGPIAMRATYLSSAWAAALMWIYSEFTGQCHLKVNSDILSSPIPSSILEASFFEEYKDDAPNGVDCLQSEICEAARRLATANIVLDIHTPATRTACDLPALLNPSYVENTQVSIQS